MCKEQNVAVVYKYWENCWNLHSPDTLNETHHLTFAQNGKPIGIPAFKKDLSGFFHCFPDIQVSIDDYIAFDNRVLTRVVYQGTHCETYAGIPAKRKSINVSGLELFLLLDGKIVQHWHEMDHLVILQQIGATVVVPNSG